MTRGAIATAASASATLSVTYDGALVATFSLADVQLDGSSFVGANLREVVSVCCC